MNKTDHYKNQQCVYGQTPKPNYNASEMKMLNSTYVMLIVSKIKKNTVVSSWKYIPGVLNIVDDATPVTHAENLN